MRPGRLLPFALLVIPALAFWQLACSEAGPAGPVGDPDLDPRFAISDGAHGGNEGFFFLPPLVDDPGVFDAGFNGSQSPVVTICDPAGCNVNQLAEFTMTTGPGSETIRVVPADEHYIVNWHTDQFAISPGETYRVSAFAFGELLGFADIAMATSGKEARNITTGELIGLADGRTLPIKFRVEEGAAAESFPITASDGGTIESADGSVAIEIPPGALTTDEEITVEPIDPTQGILTAVDFGPDGLVFDEPVLVEQAYDPATLPPGVAEEDLALNIYEDGDWIVIPGSIVDETTKTVTAPLYHFSKVGVGPANRAVFCSGDANANTFETIVDALAAVVTGGTVAVCDGTHAVEGIVLDRPVIIEAKGGASPVLQTAVSSYAFLLDGFSTGEVVIDGLNFEITTQSPGPDGRLTYAIWGTGTYSGLRVRNSTFTVGPAARGGIAVVSSTVPPIVEVENASVDGGIFGIAAISVALNITNSQFTGGRNRRVQYSSSNGRIEGSSFSDCGTTWCVHALNGSDVEIVNNTFAAHTLTGDPGPDFNNPIYVRLGANAVISGNDIQGCGYWNCIAVGTGATATITGNTFNHVAGTPDFPYFANIEAIGANVTVENNQHTSCGYSCYKFLDGATGVVRGETVNLSSGHGTGPVVLGDRIDPGVVTPDNVFAFEDNVVTGTAPGDPGDPSTYPAREGFGLKWSNVTAQRNTFTNVATGVWLGTDGSITGSDNVVDGTVTAVAIVDNGIADLSFNDFTNQVIDIEDYNGTSSLRCNWWGRVAGPVTIVAVIPASVYTPWATAPIAGTSHAGCTP